MGVKAKPGQKGSPPGSSSESEGDSGGKAGRK